MSRIAQLVGKYMKLQTAQIQLEKLDKTDHDRVIEIAGIDSEISTGTGEASQSEQSFYREQMHEFSSEDRRNADGDNYTASDRSSSKDGRRTASYLSDFREKESLEDILSDTEVNDGTKPQKETKEGQSFAQSRRRQVKQLAKMHALELLSFKVNKKLVDQAIQAASVATTSTAMGIGVGQVQRK